MGKIELLFIGYNTNLQIPDTQEGSSISCFVRLDGTTKNQRRRLYHYARQALLGQINGQVPTLRLASIQCSSYDELLHLSRFPGSADENVLHAVEHMAVTDSQALISHTLRNSLETREKPVEHVTDGELKIGKRESSGEITISASDRGVEELLMMGMVGAVIRANEILGNR